MISDHLAVFNCREDRTVSMGETQDHESKLYLCSADVTLLAPPELKEASLFDDT